MARSFDTIINQGVVPVGKNANPAFEAYSVTGDIVGFLLGGISVLQKNITEVKATINAVKNIDNNPRYGLYLLDTAVRTNPQKLPPYGAVDPSWIGATKSLLHKDKNKPKDPGPHTKVDYDQYLPFLLNENPNWIEDGKYNALLDKKEFLLKTSSQEIEKEEKLGRTIDFATHYGYLGDDTNKDEHTAIEWIMFEYQFFTGRKNLIGFSVDSTHSWEIKLEPYDNGPNTITPDFPTVYHESDPSKVMTDFKNWLPIVSYDYTVGKIKTQEIKLFNESSLTLPIGITYDHTIKISMIDDMNKTLDKYFNHYLNRIYNPITHAVTPYKNACFLLTLYVLRPDKKINLKFPLICILQEKELSYSGTEAAEHTSLDLTFTIVGVVSKYEQESFSKDGRSAQSFNWNDVSLIPDLIV